MMIFQSIPYILKLIIGLNLLITGYMWLGSPIVVDIPLLEEWGIAGVSSGPFIIINTEYAPSGTPEYQETLKHEYAHYIQQCWMTPLGMYLYNTYNVLKNFLLRGAGRSYSFYYYLDNFFEKQAFKLQRDTNFKPPGKYLHLKLGGD